LIILIILGEGYKLWSSPLCSCLQPPATSSHTWFTLRLFLCITSGKICCIFFKTNMSSFHTHGIYIQNSNFPSRRLYKKIISCFSRGPLKCPPSIRLVTQPWTEPQQVPTYLFQKLRESRTKRAAVLKHLFKPIVFSIWHVT
jgi:hypothetical protein